MGEGAETTKTKSKTEKTCGGAIGLVPYVAAAQKRRTRQDRRRWAGVERAKGKQR